VLTNKTTKRVAFEEGNLEEAAQGRLRRNQLLAMQSSLLICRQEACSAQKGATGILYFKQIYFDFSFQIT
jgi:hypothetical protein